MCNSNHRKEDSDLNPFFIQKLCAIFEKHYAYMINKII